MIVKKDTRFNEKKNLSRCTNLNSGKKGDNVKTIHLSVSVEFFPRSGGNVRKGEISSSVIFER